LQQGNVSLPCFPVGGKANSDKIKPMGIDVNYRLKFRDKSVNLMQHKFQDKFQELLNRKEDSMFWKSLIIAGFIINILLLSQVGLAAEL
jgi:hypothetical protein